MTTLTTDDWIEREDLAFRTTLCDPKFTVREVIPAGGMLYDPAFGVNWVEPDGSIIVLDVGGQLTTEFDPTAAHGALYRLTPTDELETIVAPGRLGFRGMAMFPHRAPASFAPWEGHVFVVGQTRPGRPGAHWDHAVYKLAPGDNRYELFAVLPRVGGVSDGIPGGAMPAGFGRPGTPYEGQFLTFSGMNCVVYSVDNDGEARAAVRLDGSDGVQIMPRALFFANEFWGPLEGELILGGSAGGSFTSQYIPGTDLDFWLVRDGHVVPDPVAHGPVGLWASAIAPSSWGDWAGLEFCVDNGIVNLAQQQQFHEPLPYDARILARDRDGQVRVFAENLRGGRNSLCFSGDRLLICNVGKSYSTGEFHLPDGSISEVRLA